jgi:hypothetical protein
MMPLLRQFTSDSDGGIIQGDLSSHFRQLQCNFVGEKKGKKVTNLGDLADQQILPT